MGAFGAIAGGKTAIETKAGQSGVQGPYYLTGNGEPTRSSPVSGTMKVDSTAGARRGKRQGLPRRLLARHPDLHPKNTIRDEDLIRIQYEYKLFYYERLIAGGTTGLQRRFGFSVQGVIWSEADNKNQTIDLT